MIDRRTILLGGLAAGGLAAGVLAVLLGVRAQRAEKIWRIGVLREGPPGTPPPEFIDGLRALGWVVGRNVIFERRFAARVDQLPALAIELVNQNVDLILTEGTPAAQAAKLATSTVPIVFTVGADPVERGLVASLARPGGNLTGFAWGLYDDKLLEVLKEALPTASRVAYPAREPDPTIVKSGSALGMRIVGIPGERPEDLHAFYAALRSARADAVVIPNIVWMTRILDTIATEIAKMHVPAIGTWRDFAEAGGLLSYGPVAYQQLPRIVVQIDRILRGAKPADLPVEQPTKFELIVNLKTAKALGLTLPTSLLVRANEVIQ